MIYRRRATAVHAARPAVAIGWALALTVAVIACPHPWALAAFVTALPLLAAAAQVTRPILLVTAIALPFAALWALTTGLLVHEGLTVLWDFGRWPVLGRVELTAEALTVGVTLALRGVAVLQIGMLASAVIDPDRLLRLVQRGLPRAGLTGALALRLAPALATDGRRYADGLRCRADDGGLSLRDRNLVLSATVGRAIDRADQVAAVLELRGLRDSGRLRRLPEPWSRHDVSLLGAAVAIVLATVWAVTSGVVALTPYPLTELAPTVPAVVWALATVTLAGLPLLSRTGVAQ